MLNIRKDQMDELSRLSFNDFENRMAAHIQKHFPAHYQALGRDHVRELIQFGIDRAAVHNFISQRNVCKFIDLMICHGVEFDVKFDTDKKFIWANEILTGSWINTEAKMDALFKAGIEHLAKDPG